MALLRDVKLYRDARVEDELPWITALAQILESRSALTISVESEKVRPEAASLSENSRAFLAQRLGSPVALLEGFILVFFPTISPSFRIVPAEPAFELPSQWKERSHLHDLGRVLGPVVWVVVVSSVPTTQELFTGDPEVVPGAAVEELPGLLVG